MWNRQWPTQAVSFWAAHSWWAWRDGFIASSQKWAVRLRPGLSQVRKVKFFRPSWVKPYVGYKSTNDRRLSWTFGIRPPIIQFEPCHVSPELLFAEGRGLSQVVHLWLKVVSIWWTDSVFFVHYVIFVICNVILLKVVFLFFKCHEVNPKCVCLPKLCFSIYIWYKNPVF